MTTLTEAVALYDALRAGAASRAELDAALRNMTLGDLAAFDRLVDLDLAAAGLTPREEGKP